MARLRAVVDTNVVFEGLTKRGGACGLIVEAWLAGLFTPCVANALAYEYADVLSHKLSHQKWQSVQPVLAVMLAKAEYVPVRYSWRPTSPDPGDDHVIDCAMNAISVVVTSNIADYQLAVSHLGLTVLTPVQFVTMLGKE